jgi:hypothetical protein
MAAWQQGISLLKKNKLDKATHRPGSYDVFFSVMETTITV